ncbi:hypothetical protein ACLOJK_006723 [Asimina triloba]
MPDFGAVGGLMLLCTCCRWVCWPDLMGDGSVDGRRRQGGAVVGGAAGWCACWIVLQMGGMERGRRVDGGSWSGHGRRWVDGRWLVVWPWASICWRPGEMGAAGDGGLDGWIEMAPDGGSRGGRGLLTGAGCDGPRWRLDERR